MITTAAQHRNYKNRQYYVLCISILILVYHLSLVYTHIYTPATESGMRAFERLSKGYHIQLGVVTTLTLGEQHTTIWNTSRDQYSKSLCLYQSSSQSGLWRVKLRNEKFFRKTRKNSRNFGQKCWEEGTSLMWSSCWYVWSCMLCFWVAIRLVLWINWVRDRIGTGTSLALGYWSGRKGKKDKEK